MISQPRSVVGASAISCDIASTSEAHRKPATRSSRRVPRRETIGLLRQAGREAAGLLRQAGRARRGRPLTGARHLTWARTGRAVARRRKLSTLTGVHGGGTAVLWPGAGAAVGPSDRPARADGRSARPLRAIVCRGWRP